MKHPADAACVATRFELVLLQPPIPGEFVHLPGVGRGPVKPLAVVEAEHTGSRGHHPRFGDNELAC